MDKYILDFTYLNGEYILKNFYDLKNMNNVLKWCDENSHLPVDTIYRIFNYGLIYYLDNAKYLQKEIVEYLLKHKKKFQLTKTDNDLKDYLEKWINKYKNNNEKNKDSIKFL